MRFLRFKRFVLSLACFVVLVPMQAVAADDAGFPQRPVRIIIGFPPGAGSDVALRAAAKMLSERWKQPVLIENRPGAGGMIATQELVRAAPDGHTLLYFPAALVVNPFVYPNVHYRIDRDFTPVMLWATFPLVLVTHPSVPASDVAGLLAYLRGNPGKVSFGSIGNASPPHLAGELFKRLTGVDIAHVAYQGSSPAQTDLAAGHVQMMFDTAVSAIPHTKAGRTRALAVTTAERSKLLPDLPTLQESGITGYDLAGWGGLVAPAGTPPAIVERLHADLTAALTTEDALKRLAITGGEIATMSSAGFGQFLATESAKWQKLVEQAGLRTN